MPSPFVVMAQHRRSPPHPSRARRPLSVSAGSRRRNGQAQRLVGQNRGAGAEPLLASRATDHATRRGHAGRPASARGVRVPRTAPSIYSPGSPRVVSHLRGGCFGFVCSQTPVAQRLGRGPASDGLDLQALWCDEALRRHRGTLASWVAPAVVIRARKCPQGGAQSCDQGATVWLADLTPALSGGPRPHDIPERRRGRVRGRPSLYAEQRGGKLPDWLPAHHWLSVGCSNSQRTKARNANTIAACRSNHAISRRRRQRRTAIAIGACTARIGAGGRPAT